MASERASGFERPGDVGAARGSERDTRENSVCSYISPPPRVTIRVLTFTSFFLGFYSRRNGSVIRHRHAAGHVDA